MTRGRGFTLLELLVAVALFAVVSALTYSGLMSVLQARAQTAQSAARLTAVQQAVSFLVRDLRQVADRPIRDEYGDVRPPLFAAPQHDPTLELTRGGWSNPTGVPRSALQRVAYRVEDDHLERVSWNVLDRAPGTTPYRARVLDGVLGLRLRFLDQQRQWLESWPALAADGTAVAGLPLAVEVTLELDDWDEVTRLVRLAEGGA